MSKEKKPLRAPETCPVCGAEVPRTARACPECGADEHSGWNEEETRYDGLDLPDESSSYDETLRNEGLKPRHVPKSIPVFWWLVGIGLLIAMIVLAFN